jgi:hypothetical protein
MPPKFAEIERLALDLIEHGDWAVVLDENGLRILAIDRSVYTEEHPVILMEITLDQSLDLATAEGILLDTQNRPKWDKTVHSMKITECEDGIETVYTVANFPWPMDKRDFVEFRIR